MSDDEDPRIAEAEYRRDHATNDDAPDGWDAMWERIAWGDE